jgi:hypothetical protein
VTIFARDLLANFYVSREDVANKDSKREIILFSNSKIQVFIFAINGAQIHPQKTNITPFFDSLPCMRTPTQVLRHD